MLEQALGTSLIQVSTLRQKVLELCSPARAVVIEYNLAPNKGSDILAENPPRRFSSSYVPEAGGRTFDLEVDVFDPSSFEIVEELNRTTDEEQAADSVLAAMAPKVQYLTRCIMREAFKVFPVDENGSSIDPLGVGAEAYKLNDMFHVISTREGKSIPEATVTGSKAEADPNTQQGIMGSGVNTQSNTPSGLAGGGATAHVPASRDTTTRGHDRKAHTNVVNIFDKTGVYVPSAIHSLRGFIDVASDFPFQDNAAHPKVHELSLHNSSTPLEKQLSWVRQAAKILLPKENNTERNSEVFADGDVIQKNTSA